MNAIESVEVHMSSGTRTLIGKVNSISGTLISVQMDEGVKSTMPIIDGLVYRVGQVGSFLKIPLGYTQLYGIVTKIGADAIPESLRLIAKEESRDIRFSTRWLTLVLIGQRVGNKFERGVIQFPTADDEVHLVTLEDLELIYGGIEEKSSIRVGNISVSESLPAKIDLDKLVTRHCAVLGATGSGKSNTVAILLEAIAKSDLKSARILLIDPHGEYNDSLVESSTVYKVNADIPKGQVELCIPFWALPFEELISSFPGRLSDQQKDYVRERVLEKKLKAIDHLAQKPDPSSVTSDSPIPFSLRQLWFELDDFERQSFNKVTDSKTKEIRLEVTEIKEKGDATALRSNKYEPVKAGSGPFTNQQAKGILGFLDSMRNRLLDQRFKFLYDPGDWTPSVDGRTYKDLDSLLSGWLSHDKPITILDLSGVPAEIMTSISGSVLKIVYDALFWSQFFSVGGRQQPLLLVLEEAHNYLRAGEHSISSRTVQTVAKEGRKYGVGLTLVTQRPTELDETVLSQCGTIIALRMSNKGDRGHVSASLQDELYDLVSLLPSLRTGEGLVLGEAIKIPSRVKFEKVAKAPKSSDPEVSKLWRKQKPDPKDYSKGILCWRNQKFH